MSTLKIFADPNLDGANLEKLRRGVAPHELVFPTQRAASVLAKSGPDPAIAEVDIAFGQPDVESVLNAPKLRWVQISTAGFTRYDTPQFRSAAAEKNLLVTNSSHVYAQACAEHVFAFMLANARRLPEGLSTRCANGAPEWFALREGSQLLRGQSLVILGYGGIAECLVELLAPFRMDIVALRRKPKGDEAVKIITQADLGEALAKADHVINILPDNAESQKFFNESIFASFKRGSVFYNIGRGTTVDQDALVEALRSEQLGAAWLDVTDPEPLPEDHPLWELSNCYITPHTAGGHGNEAGTLVQHFLDNFQRFLTGERLKDRIM